MIKNFVIVKSDYPHISCMCYILCCEIQGLKHALHEKPTQHSADSGLHRYATSIGPSQIFYDIL